MSESRARRAIVTAAALVLPATCWPLRALAQSATKTKQVAFVFNNIPLAELAGLEPAHPEARAFLHAMRDLGWIAGRNVAIRFLSAEGRFERLSALLGEVAKDGTDVIVASGSAAIEATAATATIPIVAIVPEVSLRDLVGTPSHPNANVTAVTHDVGELTPKRLELLKAIAPRTAKVALLTSEEWQGAEAAGIEASARALAITLVWIKVDSVDGMEAGLAQALRQRVDAIAVDDSQTNFAKRRRIAEFALTHRLATTSAYTEFVEDGGLMAYESNLAERERRVASYVDKILKGAKPADLPVLRPTVFDLVVNARTARALGLTIPASLQLSITRTIE